MNSAGRRPTWKVLQWDGDIGDRRPSEIEFRCPHCGWDAYCPTRGDPHSPVIAQLASGGLVFDRPGYEPPQDWMPTAIQCRKCRTILVEKGKKGGVDYVRQAV